MEILSNLFLSYTLFALFVNQVLGLTFTNCGSSSDPLIVNQLSATPDPIKMPGNL